MGGGIVLCSTPAAGKAWLPMVDSLKDKGYGTMTTGSSINSVTNSQPTSR